MTKAEHQTKIARYWEIDALRGVAILLMAFFHLMWDLDSLGMTGVNVGSRPWQSFARTIGSMFLFILGVSLVLSHARTGHERGFKTYLLRGGQIFFWGLVITGVTYLALGRGFVVFGILHLLGFSVVAAYPFLPYRRRWLALVVGLACLAAGAYVDRQVSLTPWWIWLGITQLGRPMADYYPVLPWFGVALLGVWAGHVLYPGGRRRYPLRLRPIQALSWLGRHSLLFYLVHQPLILGILYAIRAILSARSANGG